jgi:hypothetical protein
MAAVPLTKKKLVVTPIERDSSREVIFELNPNFPLTLLSARLEQKFEHHDLLVLKYAGKIEDSSTFIGSGDPVTFNYSGGQAKATWVGYVHKVIPGTIADNSTTIICASPTYLLKNTKQKIYKNVTADQIVQKIAKQYGMKAVTQRHPRVFSSIGQGGQSDWQLLRRLAKQTGFGLKINGTTIYFMSKNKLATSSKPKSSYFFKEGAAPTSRVIQQMGTIFDFVLHVSDEAPDFIGSTVDRVVSGLHQTNNKPIATKHAIKPAAKKTLGAVVPNKKFLKK